jgi:hypothetical protein
VEDRVRREELLEVGLIASAVALFAALASLASGGALGRARRAVRHAAPAPSAGAVPHERHAHVSSVSAR